MKLDLADPSSAAIRAASRCESIVHLAWGGLPNYQSARHVEQELPRHIRLLDAILADGGRSLLCAGTCFEYGMREGELSEDQPATPANPYGLAKDLLRGHIERSWTSAGRAWTWARLFYMHGDGQAASSVWSQLSEHVQRGATSFPMSGGQQVRDYLPVAVVAEYLARLAVCGSGHGLLNICSGEGRTLEQTVRSWIAENGWSIELQLGRFPYAAHEPFVFWGSRVRLDRALECCRASEVGSKGAT